jgi:hypothetical protein
VSRGRFLPSGASQITFGLKLELISAFERRSTVDKSSERAVFLQVSTGAEKFCVSIALSSRTANSVSTALDHQLLSEHLGIAGLAFHSGFAEPINSSFSLSSAPLDGYPLVHHKRANSYP